MPPQNIVTYVNQSACLVINWTAPSDLGHDSSAVYHDSTNSSLINFFFDG